MARTYLGWEWRLRILLKTTLFKQSLQLINKAIAEYDTYLASNDSDEESVIGPLRSSTQETKQVLLRRKAVTDRSPDYAPTVGLI